MVAHVVISPGDEQEHLRSLTEALAGLDVERIARWGSELGHRLHAGRRLLVAGNGGSAAEAQHLTAELLGRYQRERRPVAAVALHADTSTVTAVANDYGFEHVYARQIRAMAHPGDIVLLLSTSGRSPNLLRAAEAARAAGADTWALTGRGPNPLAELADDAVTVECAAPATVQECHLAAVHMLAAAVDRLSGETPRTPGEPVPAGDTPPVAASPTLAIGRAPTTAGRTAIVVVGDTLLDRDSTGSVQRLSPEAPVPVLSDPDVTIRPGGAGLAAALAARGDCDVTLITATSDDAQGATLRALFEESQVRLVDLGLAGPTPVKSRIRAANRTLLMIDEAGAAAEVGADVPAVATAALGAADAILVSDYGRGVTSVPRLRRILADQATRVPVVWDPHPRGTAPVPGACLALPNSREAAVFTGQAPDHERDLTADVAAARDLAQRWNVDGVVVTRGAHGAVLLQDHLGTPLVVNGRDVVVHDSCGAGDQFAVAVTTLLARRVPAADAVTTAVDVASDYVATGGPRRVTDGRRDGGDPRAVPDEQDPLRLAQRVRARGGTVVAIGGCFDLLHRGHVQALDQARRFGDCLIVCLNSDDSIARIKGPARPVRPAADRATMLLSLRSVDGVLVFDEDTPEQALRSLRPDLFVKGGDYAMMQLPEAEAMRAWGGQVVSVPFVAGHSTTSLIHELDAAGS